MAQCSVCSHQKVSEINRRILTGRRIVETAREFGVNRGTLYAHMRNHLPWRSSRAKKPVTAEEKMQELEFELSRLRVLALCGEKVGEALRVVVQQRSLLELQMRAEHRLGATHKKLFPPGSQMEEEYEVVFLDGRPKTVTVSEAKRLRGEA